MGTDTTITIVGVIVGFLFGLSGIATLFNFMSDVISEASVQLSQLSAVSTLVLLVIAIILIVKVRIISALIVGAIIGAVLNLILKLNGIDIVNQVFHTIMSNI
jgi:hypothetical protein